MTLSALEETRKGCEPRDSEEIQLFGGPKCNFTLVPSARFFVCVARSPLNRIPSIDSPAQRFVSANSPPMKKGVLGMSLFPCGSGPFRACHSFARGQAVSAL